jgi:RNA polymerase sigma-70 factor, ECF subfamily
MTSTISRLAFDPPSLRGEGLAGVCVSTVPIEAPKAEKSLLGQIIQRWCSDEELAAQLQAGNAEALSVLLKRHNRLIFGIARRILGNAAEAEDAVQQTFLDVFRSIHQFKSEKGNFKAWLLMFAYHRSLNIRRALCAGRFFDTDSLNEALLDFPAQVSGPQGFSYAEMRVLVEQVLLSVPARERRAIELVYYDGLTAEEVSARTGETVRVVRHNLYRGLDKIRKALCASPGPAEVGSEGGPR